MEIPGYVVEAEAELYDATALAEDPAFWSYHLCGTVNGAHEFFGVPDEDFRRMRDRLTDPTRWPVLTISLSGGHAVFIVYENYELTPAVEYEYAVNYLLRPAARATTLPLSTTDMEGSYAGLRWPELAALATPAGVGGIQRSGARLLATLPILGDADLPLAAATDMVTEALRELGATAPAAQAAALLTDREFCGDESWAANADGVWTCEDKSSSRYRGDSPSPQRETDLVTISRALDPHRT
ncbi:hypothetical protein [Nocardia sp. NPDC051463]|uniref:hypothetical protein n=1 Tax=Nocardia sp. NPDC051463 TaxID=3154845 RepID=UPI00344F375A